jgi:hypothetical protein
MADDDSDRKGSKTISVPEAGRRYYGLSRDGSYRAAKRGDIPVISVGKLLRVPVAAMERILASVTDNCSPRTADAAPPPRREPADSSGDEARA